MHSRERPDEDIKTPIRCVEGGGELWDIYSLRPSSGFGPVMLTAKRSICQSAIVPCAYFRCPTTALLFDAEKSGGSQMPLTASRGRGRLLRLHLFQRILNDQKFFTHTLDPVDDLSNRLGLSVVPRHDSGQATLCARKRQLANVQSLNVTRYPQLCDSNDGS